MIRKYHNHKLQTTPWHREEEPLNHHKTPGRQIKQSNQNEATRIATGATKLVSINNLYKEICGESLQKRRNDHKLTLFFKMYNHLTPEYLSSLIPQQVNEIAHYNLRNSNNIQTIRAKTNQYNNSFLPSVFRNSNTLPAEAKQLNTLS